MGMVVRTNTMALNAYRQLGMNNSAVSKSLEKLSSGFRINRAGDDAAGLAISEKMKAQITGLETASSNAQDGISLIQTAEGNLTEVHDMLNRMVELATKSANGTYTQTERDALQSEVDALLDEIDRISQSANFNGTNLLDGTMGLNAGAFTVGKPGGVAATKGADLTSKLTFATRVAAGDATYHEGGASTAQVNPSFSVDLGDLAIAKGSTAAADTSTVEITVGGVTMKTGDLAGEKDYSAKDIAAELMKNFANWAGKNADMTSTATEVYVDIGDLTFKVTGSDTALNFDYAGLKANKDDMAATDKFTEANATALNGAIGSGVTVGGTVNAKAVKTGDVMHDTMNVTQAVAQEDGKRAGIDVTLDKTLVAVGNTITIDGKDFTMVSKADAATVGANELNIDPTLDLTDDDDLTDALHSIVDQLSKKTTDNFVIESKSGTTIHIDQKVGNKNVYDTEDKLKALVTAKAASTGVGTALTVKAADKIVKGDALTIGGKTYTFVEEGSGEREIVMGEGGASAVENLTKALEKDGFTVTDKDGALVISGPAGAKTAPSVGGGGLTLQIGDTADDFNKMTVGVPNMSAAGLGLSGLSIETQQGASDAIDKIKTAINSVSTARADMGALQNRLEHTINNLDVAVENLSSANSRIRDTDMAKEMMNYTKMNVLVQSAQAMLAQANQQPQSVLQLLQ